MIIIVKIIFFEIFELILQPNEFVLSYRKILHAFSKGIQSS
jgi:hypothetical protein